MFQYGAARGNPEGLASWGVVVWFRAWSVQGFDAMDVLEAHGVPIGIVSNNAAEYQGCAQALRLLLDRIIGLTKLQLRSAFFGYGGQA